jgi:AcrR family transcriptional regulator
MAIVVEHDKRRREILENALDVFVAEGFENTTFQKIAERCGITRTTLYIYFKNKKQIFNYSIKQLTGEVEADMTKVRDDTTLSCIDKLIKVLQVIIDRLEENRRLISVVLDYLLYLSKGKNSPDTIVRRRTIRLRHFLAAMLIEGIRSGEVAPVALRIANTLIYSLLETAIFRLGVLKHSSATDLKQAAALMLRSLSRNEQ